MATQIVLIRHAAIDTGSRLCGSFDLPLSATGRGELHALLRRPARTQRPDALLASTLTRATEVARELGCVWGLEPCPAAWAREIHCGDVEGMRLDDVQQRFPELWSRNREQNDDAFAWPNGETYAHFRVRVLAGLADVAGRYPDGRVAVVTHAGVISQVVGVLKRRPASIWEQDRPDPLSATEVVWAHGAPRTLHSFNDRDWY